MSLINVFWTNIGGFSRMILEFSVERDGFSSGENVGDNSL